MTRVVAWVAILVALAFFLWLGLAIATYDPHTIGEELRELNELEGRLASVG